ncbi:MAG: alpha-L-fucosidase [bacterium]
MKSLLLPALMVALAFVSNAHSALDFEVTPESRANWLNEDKFGMFIHWGLYAEPARGEWVMCTEKIPVEKYKLLAAKFNPIKFDAKEWVRIVKDAGMKYIVITSKHHDGFALFDSQASDYNLVKASPFQRDAIQELKDACDLAGIKLGLYYSQAKDWYHKGGEPLYDWKEQCTPEDRQHYLDTIALPQVKEIASKYRPSLIWFDTPQMMTPEIARKFSDTVRSVSPDTLINSRLLRSGASIAGLSREDRDVLRDVGVDYLSFRDREIPEASPWPYWETCMTLNDSWGYTANDHNWKTPQRVVQQLLEVVSKGGTFLLNVGPTAEGEIPSPSIDTLKKTGEWLQVNGEAVYGAQPTKFKTTGTPSKEFLAKKAEMEKKAAETGSVGGHLRLELDYAWIATGKGKKIFITLFDWPAEDFQLENFDSKIKECYLLSDPQSKLQATLENQKLSVKFPSRPAGDMPSVLCLKLTDCP